MKIVGTFEEIEFTRNLFDRYCIEDCENCRIQDICGCGCEPKNIEYEVIEDED